MTATATPRATVPAAEPDNGPGIGTLVGLGVVAALAVGSGVVWWRRRDSL